LWVVAALQSFIQHCVVCLQHHHQVEPPARKGRKSTDGQAIGQRYGQTHGRGMAAVRLYVSVCSTTRSDHLQERAGGQQLVNHAVSTWSKTWLHGVRGATAAGLCVFLSAAAPPGQTTRRTKGREVWSNTWSTQQGN
jgi:hypothetical protein